jgi:hypothetical protein
MQTKITTQIHQQIKIACKKKLRTEDIQRRPTTIWSTYFVFLFAIYEYNE